MVMVPSGLIVFQSAPPAKGATRRRRFQRHRLRVSIRAPREGGDGGCGSAEPEGEVSIRAPREGGDLIFNELLCQSLSFNPRPPRRGRQSPTSTPAPTSGFQSAPPAKGATNAVEHRLNQAVFQSAPPAKGATRPGGPW